MNDKLQQILAQPVVFDVTEAGLTALESKYATVPDVRDKDGYELCRIGIGELRGLRVGVDKRRKELKADALDYCNRVESTAKQITARIVALEEPMKTAKQIVDAEVEAEKEARRNAEINRINGIRASIEKIKRMAVMFPGDGADEVKAAYNSLLALEVTESVYMELTEEATTAKAETMAHLDAMMERIAEQERIAEEIRIENERVRLEQAAEREKQKAEREKLSAEKAAMEAELNAQREAIAAERAEMARQQREIEQAQRQEQERIEAENRARQEAIEDAELDAQREAMQAMCNEKPVGSPYAEIVAQAFEIVQQSNEMKHLAARIEIIDALLKYGCKSSNAETLADALTTGMVPHMIYQMEIA
jgi:hypothetical protein